MTILLDFMYTQLKEPIDNKISIDSDIKWCKHVSFFT